QSKQGKRRRRSAHAGSALRLDPDRRRRRAKDELERTVGARGIVPRNGGGGEAQRIEAEKPLAGTDRINVIGGIPGDRTANGGGGKIGDYEEAAGVRHTVG